MIIWWLQEGSESSADHDPSFWNQQPHHAGQTRDESGGSEGVEDHLRLPCGISGQSSASFS